MLGLEIRRQHQRDTQSSRAHEQMLVQQIGKLEDDIRLSNTAYELHRTQLHDCEEARDKAIEQVKFTRILLLTLPNSQPGESFKGQLRTSAGAISSVQPTSRATTTGRTRLIKHLTANFSPLNLSSNLTRRGISAVNANSASSNLNRKRSL